MDYETYEWSTSFSESGTLFCNGEHQLKCSHVFNVKHLLKEYPKVKRWCKMIRETGAIDLSKPSGCHRTVFTKVPIQKIKRKSKGGKRIYWRKLVLEMDMSFSSAYRILRKDLKM